MAAHGRDLYRRVRRLERQVRADRRRYKARGIPTRRWKELRGEYWRARRLEVLRTVPGAAKPKRGFQPIAAFQRTDVLYSPGPPPPDPSTSMQLFG